MAFKLDDLINKKKEPNQILDLSKTKIRTKEEFEKYFDKIPEYKIRPEKVRPEDCRPRENDYSFTYNKKEARLKSKHQYTYGDPIPPSMKSVRLEDLAAVSINWRMLTMIRPDNKLEEEIFCRLVDLGKLRLSTGKAEAKAAAGSGGGGGGGTGGGNNNANPYLGIYIVKSKRGVAETRIRCCKDCGEEVCTGPYCKEYPYDSYTRMMVDSNEMEGGEGSSKAKRRSSKSSNRKGSKASKGGLPKGVKGGTGKKKKRKKKAKVKEEPQEKNTSD